MRVYNFGAGPAMLPESVLQQSADEMLDYKGSGMSVKELSHRQSHVIDIANETEELFRELMSIPKNYKVLFCQGGASMQFAMVPFNLYRTGVCDFLITGMWSERAAAQSKQYLTVNEVASSKDKNFSYIPQIDENKLSKNADYFHYTANNTIYGTAVNNLPNTNAPIVADMTSCILGRDYNVSKFGIIYASTQKQVGITGLTVVIVREDLIGKPHKYTPIMLNYETYSKNESMYNTPPVYSIYMTLLVLRWIKEQGGVVAMEKNNIKKSDLVYNLIDNSKLYKPYVEKSARSIMNITFSTGNSELDKKFVKQAEENGLVSLGGYRLTGGMRVSLYNPFPIAGVEKLVSFMKHFEEENINE
ncbi:MAG: 3-phosphoserine/phosphohydroxythreonine transaminase [Defluviitaleaceae bacterium]|nr:3-phosphoserine/phosphohydroxythreonine transaminase [Defluviitaleaceae bacterium]